VSTDPLSAEERRLARDRIEKKILLSSLPVSSQQIEQSLGLHEEVVRACLRELNKSGRIRDRGTGGRHKLWEWSGRNDAPVKAPGRLAHTPSTPYTPEPWSHESARPQGSQHEQCPSRMGNTLFYRDGRQENIQ
jgi:hypothetical protein